MQRVSLTIDPGLTGTGVVAWDEEISWKDSLKIFYVDASLFKTNSTRWELGAQEISQNIRQHYRMFSVQKIYIEFPQVFQSSLGMAAINRGDIFKLVFLIGCIRGAFLTTDFEPILVSKWKGQLPKKEIEYRCKKIIPRTLWVKTSHLWDAVGIGLYLTGKI